MTTNKKDSTRMKSCPSDGEHQRQHVGPIPNQTGPIEENPIIETITFTVAFRRRHEGKSRYELVPDALDEYAQSVKNQLTMHALRGKGFVMEENLKTFKGRTNAFESDDGVLVWWENERESRGKYVVMATRNELADHVFGSKRLKNTNVWEHAECKSFEEAANIRESALANGADKVMIVEQCPIVYKDGRYHT